MRLPLLLGINMDERQFERRKGTQEPEDALPPDVLALLVLCGGRVRASDRVSTPARSQEFPDRRRKERRGADFPAQPGLF